MVSRLSRKSVVHRPLTPQRRLATLFSQVVSHLAQWQGQEGGYTFSTSHLQAVVSAPQLAHSFCCHAAPAGTIVNGSSATSGDYDSGDVCAAQDNAFIYVMNTCTNTTADALDVTVTVSLLWASCPACCFLERSLL